MFIIYGIIFGAVLIFGGICLWMEQQDLDRLAVRLATDPEFAEKYHEIHKYDDWEDSGYFDGR